jgi:UDP-glucose:(heptosyl)LPS alpha-1,3-glucosyltransferase
MAAMKIAIIRQRYNPYGGAERFVERALGALAAEGAEVTLITRSWDGAPREDFRQIICNPLSTGWLAGRAGRDKAFSSCVQQAIAVEGFDLVQSHERVPGCSIFRAGDGVHAAWLAHRERFLPPWRRLAQRLSPYHRYVLAAEEAMFAHPALRAVICNSHMVAEEITQYYGVDRSKLHVIYNGVDTDDFHPRLAGLYRAAVRARLGLAETTPLLLYVGSGYERKGVPQLLRAFVQAAQSGAHLVVIGADRKLAATRRLADRLGITANTHFLGPVKDVRPFYGAADAFVLPSLYDPCPNAALEAMACGLPILTGQACGAREWVVEGKNGLVVDPLSGSELAKALDELISLALQPAAHALARQRVEVLDLTTMSSHLLKLYRQLSPQA